MDEALGLGQQITYADQMHKIGIPVYALYALHYMHYATHLLAKLC